MTKYIIDEKTLVDFISAELILFDMGLLTGLFQSKEKLKEYRERAQKHLKNYPKFSGITITKRKYKTKINPRFLEDL